MALKQPHVKRLPHYPALIVEGRRFPVLRSDDKYLIGKDELVIEAVLRLTADQFAQAQALLGQAVIHVQREGVDPTPIATHRSGNFWWSKHEENGSPYYTQHIKLAPAPPDNPAQKQREKNQALIRLLQSWRESDDAAEQRETLAYLMQAIDEDRLSERKLFT